MAVVAIIIVIIVAGGAYWWMTQQKPEPTPTPSPTPTPTPTPTPPPEENEPPLAAAFVSKWSGNVGESIGFDASKSRDPDGEIVKYTWDFGDGKTEESTSSTITHAFDYPGNYIVILTVEDDGGLTDTTESRLTFVSVRHPETTPSADSPPTGVLAIDKDVAEPGDTITFDASSSWGWAPTETGFDKSTGEVTSWVVEFGDGETGEGSSLEHSYNSPGHYIAELTVTAANGLTDTVLRTIHVLSSEAEYEGVVKNPDTLILAHVAFVHSLDPAECHASPQPGESLDNMYDKLVWFKENLREVEPWLAERWDISDDGLTYTFYLRQGVKFHDGTELTAEDVAYSFERQFAIYIPEGHISMLTDPFFGTTDPRGFTMEDIRNSIEVVDEYTIAFHLKNPFAPFMKVLTDYDYVVVNKDLVIANGGYDPAQVVTDQDREAWLGRYDPWLSRSDAGSGPYELVEFVPGQRLVFEAFDDYWQGKPSFKRVIVLFIPELSTRIMMLKNGDIDYAAIPMAYRSQVEGVEGIKVYSGAPSNTADFITINFDIDPEWLTSETHWLGETGSDCRGDLFQDRNLRKALAYAFDYDAYIEQATLGEAPRATCPVPPGWMGHTPAYNYSYDPAKAEENFRKAWDGQIWEEGFSIPIIYTVGAEANRIGGEILKEGVEAINPKFRIMVMPVDQAVYNAVAWTGKSPLTLTGDWINYPDPHIAYEQQIGSYSLFQRAGSYVNERADQLISDAFKETDEVLREEMYFEIAEFCGTDVMHIYRTYATEFEVMREWLNGYFSNPWYSSLYWFWLSK